MPGGRVVRVIPDGVVTCRTPSGVVSKRQPRAKVLRRWWLRHRQHRLAQSVGPPAAWGTTWSASAQPTPWPQVGERQVRSRVCTNACWAAVGVWPSFAAGRSSTAQPRCSSGCWVPPRRAGRRNRSGVVVARRVPSSSVSARVTDPPSGACRSRASSRRSSSRRWAAVMSSPSTSPASVLRPAREASVAMTPRTGYDGPAGQRATQHDRSRRRRSGVQPSGPGATVGAGVQSRTGGPHLRVHRRRRGVRRRRPRCRPSPGRPRSGRRRCSTRSRSPRWSPRSARPRAG